MGDGSPHRYVIACVVAVALLTVLLVPAARSAQAQANTAIQINEIVAANDSYIDAFGGTPDYIELRNTSSNPVSLAGWTISDGGGPWAFPASASLAAGERIVVHASGRDVFTPELHTDFALARAGETVSLADADGVLVDTLTYPTLVDDQAYGRGTNGGVGFLLAPTPGAPNGVLAPSGVTIETPAQTFEGALQISLAATTQAGEQVRFTTNGDEVALSSPVYTGPFEITTSTIVRAAVVGNGVIGPEASTGYIAVSSNIANSSSDLPLVFVQATGPIGSTLQDAIVTVVDRAVDGRASVLGPADYAGFAGLRIRGATSAAFPKKQYKFELWGDQFGNELSADLLGLGSDSDWGLYAPGYHDRAMINNSFVYELGHRLGVAAPDYQFVELYIEDNSTSTIGASDYQGIYLLRETIEIDDERVDITEHTPTSAGANGGYIIRYDWDDNCCRNIGPTPWGGSVVEVDRPSDIDLTDEQFAYVSDLWFDTIDAAATSYEAAAAYLDYDALIDRWLIEMVAFDIDINRASHYWHIDAGGKWQPGPLWDYDRSLGGEDRRVDELIEGESWFPGRGELNNGQPWYRGLSGHTYDALLYDDLWTMPEIQAQLRARWAELRAPGAVLSDGELAALIFAQGDEIAEAYVRETAEWGSVSGYGSRYGGLSGELNFMRDWVLNRASWLDDQFLSDAGPPVITLPASVDFSENQPFVFQVEATDAQTIVYAETGLPEGLSIDPVSGVISGIVGFGDGYQQFPVTVTVTDSTGASSSASTVFADPAALAARPNPVVLNEFNPVAPGGFLRQLGADTTLGRVGGNGGDWFELVTIEDQLDMRGWTFDLFSNDDAGDVVQTASLILNQDELFADLRAGTIITVAESTAEDLSYDPVAGDWTINLQSTNSQLGSTWANQTNFDTNHKRWRLVIRDDTGQIVSFVGGETEAWRDIGIGQNLSSSQSFGIGVDPSAAVDNSTLYLAGNASSFGAPNVIDGGTQDFSALRPLLADLGDVNCSGGYNVADALTIAQYSASNRDAVDECPLANPAEEIFLDAADVDGNGRVNIGDALLIAQCSANNANVFCPNDE